MKKFLLFCSVISLSFLSVAFADYSIYVEEVGNTDVGFGKTDKYLVEFKGINQNKKMYVDGGYELSLDDAPEITDGENKYYTWKITSANNNSVNFDLVSSDYKVSDNVVVTATEHEFPSNVGSLESEYKESQRPGGINDDSDEGFNMNYQNINIQVSDTVITKNVNCYISLMNDRATSWFHSRYNNEFSLHDSLKLGDDAVQVKLMGGDKKIFGDDSIGLECVDENVSNYKPVTGVKTLSSGLTNYVVYRFVLNNDLIIKSSFKIGGHNGFYQPYGIHDREIISDGYAYLRARQYSGFIVGAYYEIDLNGHDLVLANGANVTCYGSITDSSKDKKGNLILENGSTFMSSIVTEGQYHETDIVSAYKYSQDPFKMFRCPYINCNMIIKSGSKFQGRIVKADGGNKNTVGFASTTTLIGPSDSNAFIQLISGKILRKVDYDEELKNKNNTMLNKNIMYQKIKYYVYDAYIDCRWLSFEGINISGIDFNLYSYKYPTRIPPYFDFYIYNSTVKLHQEFIFMPGVYMHVDQFSNFKFSNTSVTNVNISGAGINDGLQGVSGLVFLPKFHLVSQHNVSHGIINDGEGDASSPFVYYQVNPFWEYYNGKGATCDFYGTISFEDDYSTDYHKHEFGGNINIYNRTDFIAKVSNHNNVSLYSNVVFADLLYGIKGTVSKKTVSFIVGGFYQIPLISEGYSLYDPINDAVSISNKFTYDKDLSLIKDESMNEYYVFGFKWPDSNMSHPYGSDVGSASDSEGPIYTNGDSLTGKFFKVLTLNKDNYSLSFYNDYKSTSYTCINFQGGYIIASSVSGNSATAKLGLAVGGDGTNSGTDYNFNFTTSGSRKYWKKA